MLHATAPPAGSALALGSATANFNPNTPSPGVARPVRLAWLMLNNTIHPKQHLTRLYYENHNRRTRSFSFSMLTFKVSLLLERLEITLFKLGQCAEIYESFLVCLFAFPEYQVILCRFITKTIIFNAGAAAPGARAAGPGLRRPARGETGRRRCNGRRVHFGGWQTGRDVDGAPVWHACLVMFSALGIPYTRAIGGSHNKGCAATEVRVSKQLSVFALRWNGVLPSAWRL